MRPPTQHARAYCAIPRGSCTIACVHPHFVRGLSGALSLTPAQPVSSHTSTAGCTRCSLRKGAVQAVLLCPPAPCAPRSAPPRLAARSTLCRARGVLGTAPGAPPAIRHPPRAARNHAAPCARPPLRTGIACAVDRCRSLPPCAPRARACRRCTSSAPGRSRTPQGAQCLWVGQISCKGTHRWVGRRKQCQWAALVHSAGS